jgi:RNA polymerase sigma factor (sigma-70 family)
MAILQHKPNDINEAARLLTPMIAKMAHKYARNHRARDFDDLFQDGMEGFTMAYNRFDPSKGSAFSSYVYQYAWAYIKDRAMGKWKDYNNTSGTSYEDHNLGEYSLPLEDLADYNNLKAKMDPTTRAIHSARQQGFTYREIAEAMTKLGKPCTLHQVRRQHLEAIEA